jgi:hypothetical protein
MRPQDYATSRENTVTGASRPFYATTLHGTGYAWNKSAFPQSLSIPFQRFFVPALRMLPIMGVLKTPSKRGFSKHPLNHP